MYQNFITIVTDARPNLDRGKLINDYGAKVFEASKAQQYGYIDDSESNYSKALFALVEKAGIGAQGAMGTDFQPGAHAGLAGGVQGGPEFGGIDVEIFHLGVIFLAALVPQGGIQLLLGIDGILIAQDSFGHLSYSSGSGAPAQAPGMP